LQQIILIFDFKMRISLAFFLLAFLTISSVIAQNDTRVNELLKEADALVVQNNLPQALAKTREALAIAPEYHPALQKQINIHFLMNDEKESVKEVEDAIKKYPEMPVYHYLRGIINNSRGRYSKALDDFGRAIELNPGDLLYRCYLGRGVSYLNLLEYDEALADFTASIEQNDTVASTYYSRAMVNYELRDYPSAINDFKKALEHSAGNSELYFNLGMSYYRLNEKDKACPNFNKSCSMGNINACKMTLMECAKAIPNLP
jgi:tetratricopeptide (TPR) repeat protein